MIVYIITIHDKVDILLKFINKYFTRINKFEGDISDFKKGCKPRNNSVKNDKVGLVIDSYIIFAGLRKHFSQILNVHRANDVRQAEIHSAEPLVPESSAFEVEMATGKLKRHKYPNIDQIPAN